MTTDLKSLIGTAFNAAVWDSICHEAAMRGIRRCAVKHTHTTPNNQVKSAPVTHDYTARFKEIQTAPRSWYKRFILTPEERRLLKLEHYIAQDAERNDGKNASTFSNAEMLDKIQNATGQKRGDLKANFDSARAKLAEQDTKMQTLIKNGTLKPWHHLTHTIRHADLPYMPERKYTGPAIEVTTLNGTICKIKTRRPSFFKRLST